MTMYEGQVAIVTGGAGGIGSAVARRLDAEGARVAVVDVNGDAAEVVCKDLGHDALAIAADVTSEDGVASYVDAVMRTCGRIDLFHNNAGILGPLAQLGEVSVADFDHVMSINLRGVFLGLRAVLPVMRERGRGAVVNTGSVAGMKGTAGISPYVASKWAVIGLTKTAAREMAPFGVRVNAVCPAATDTPFMDKNRDAAAAVGIDDPDAAMVQLIPLGRLAQPGDIASAVAWLLGDEAAFVTGVALPVDGGQMA